MVCNRCDKELNAIEIKQGGRQCYDCWSKECDLYFGSVSNRPPWTGIIIFVLILTFLVLSLHAPTSPEDAGTQTSNSQSTVAQPPNAQHNK